MRRKIDQAVLDAIHKNPDNWKAFFYINKKDYRIIVPEFYRRMAGP